MFVFLRIRLSVYLFTIFTSIKYYRKYDFFVLWTFRSIISSDFLFMQNFILSFTFYNYTVFWRISLFGIVSIFKIRRKNGGDVHMIREGDVHRIRPAKIFRQGDSICFSLSLTSIKNFGTSDGVNRTPKKTKG